MQRLCPNSYQPEFDSKYGSAAMGLSAVLALYLLSREVENRGGEMEHDTMSYFCIEVNVSVLLSSNAEG
jgi:hypothetical protein